MINGELIRYLYKNNITEKNYNAHMKVIRSYFDSDEACNLFIAQNIADNFIAKYENFMEHHQSIDVFPIKSQYGHSATMNFYAIQYVLHGHCPCIINEQSFLMREGDICILPPNTTQQYFQFSSDDFVICIVIPPENISKIMPRILKQNTLLSHFFQGKHSIFHFHTIPDSIFREHFLTLFQMIHIEKETDPIKGLYFENILENIFLMLLMEHNVDMASQIKQHPEKDHSMYLFINYIQENLSTVSLSSLSKHFGYNESYVSRMFQKTTGHSYTDTVRALKLEKAAELLSSTDKSVEEIMEQIGYAGRTNFFFQFKKRFLLTPLEYRNNSR
ncbi:MAG: AraC family transcriptional regulator [Lachnospiraceae bacterium]|nr:AraC family transcriptional regulator [Lachnospiraceae bacterium]